MRLPLRRLDDIRLSAVDTLLPPVCPGCGRRGHWVCPACRAEVAPIDRVGCARCGAPEGAGCVCAELPDGVAEIRSAYPFDGWVRESIHALKYEGERARGRFLGDLLAATVRGRLDVDLVVPVPIHPDRRRERGFNQATLLAERLGRALADRPVTEIERRGTARAQVGLTGEERRRNVRGAFAVPDPGGVAGRSVVLVDDVITTTATVAACAEALVGAGAVSVRCVSLARAV